MEQKKTGSIPGIYGCLGYLASIDKKYDLAISTATGKSLDNILVDTVETAKKCVEYLKKSNAGLCNLLALDQILKYEPNVTDPFQTPENAPRLIDLITVDDPSIKTVFYQYLKDTLVAEDMDQAKRIAFGDRKFRVVTLSGDLIETSRAMSGEGCEKMSGMMDSQATTKKNEVNLEKLEEQFETKLISSKKDENKKEFHNKVVKSESDVFLSIAEKNPDVNNNIKLKNIYSCMICDKKFKRKSVVKKHIDLKHFMTKRYFCEYEDCEYSCLSKSSIDVHINDKHLKLKPFKCEECDLCFGKNSSLKTHIEIVHEGIIAEKKPDVNNNIRLEKIYSCKICDKIFKRKSHVKEHINLKHFLTKRYFCEFKNCDYSCLCKSSIDDHMNGKHLKLKPFKCEECDKSFGKKSTLKTHIKMIHEGIKFKCSMCNAKLCKKQSLEQHLETIHFLKI